MNKKNYNKIKVTKDRTLIALNLLKKGQVIVVFKNLKTRFFSEKLTVGLQRSSTKVFNSPKAKIELRISKISNSDFDKMKDFHRHERLVNEKIKYCYKAVDKEGEICYRQWLIGYNENDKIKKYFGNLFLRLDENEALVEGIFTKPDFRGLGIMSHAMSTIAELGFELNYKRILVFVDIENIPSVKGCIRAGFEPYIVRKEKWRFGKRYIVFENLSTETEKYIFTLLNK